MSRPFQRRVADGALLMLAAATHAPAVIAQEMMNAVHGRRVVGAATTAGIQTSRNVAMHDLAPDVGGHLVIERSGRFESQGSLSWDARGEGDSVDNRERGVWTEPYRALERRPKRKRVPRLQHRDRLTSARAVALRLGNRGRKNKTAAPSRDRLS
jgi:hypothetical protein